MFEGDGHIGRTGIRRVEVVKVDDSEGVQKITVRGLEGEQIELAYRGQMHGLTGVPSVGSIGYMFYANGRPDQSFILGVEHPDERPKSLAEGETCFYGKGGQKIICKANGDVEIRPGAGGIVKLNPA